jgi:hypothetical protein
LFPRRPLDDSTTPSGHHIILYMSHQLLYTSSAESSLTKKRGRPPGRKNNPKPPGPLGQITKQHKGRREGETRGRKKGTLNRPKPPPTFQCLSSSGGGGNQDQMGFTSISAELVSVQDIWATFPPPLVTSEQWREESTYEALAQLIKDMVRWFPKILSMNDICRWLHETGMSVQAWLPFIDYHLRYSVGNLIRGCHPIANQLVDCSIQLSLRRPSSPSRVYVGDGLALCLGKYYLPSMVNDDDAVFYRKYVVDYYKQDLERLRNQTTSDQNFFLQALDQMYYYKN